jgi:uncharacterized protein (DUF427 family)
VEKNTILGESDKKFVVEGNHYFPPDLVKEEYFRSSDRYSTCPWKGLVSYYHIDAGGKVNRDAAWYYPEPKEAAKQVKNYVAFWRGVKVSE